MPNISMGPIYISRDVVFDESVFPFAELHRNVGARYSSEVLLPTTIQRDGTELSLNDSHATTNVSPPNLWLSDVVQPQKIPEPSTRVHTDPDADLISPAAVLARAIPVGPAFEADLIHLLSPLAGTDSQAIPYLSSHHPLGDCGTQVPVAVLTL
jgi:hypothetical protein